MKTLKFSIKIRATKEKVWEILWNDNTYRKWTAIFSEGSHALSDWKEGSKILFLNHKAEGMFSIIKKKIPYSQMIFKHLGEIKNGVEVIKNWEGALERYFLNESNGLTELNVELDCLSGFEPYFNASFPKALEQVKQLSEN